MLTCKHCGEIASEGVLESGRVFGSCVDCETVMMADTYKLLYKKWNKTVELNSLDEYSDNERQRNKNTRKRSRPRKVRETEEY